VPKPYTADAAIADHDSLFLQLVGDALLPLGGIFQ